MSVFSSPSAADTQVAAARDRAAVSYALLALRIFFGVAMIAHGSQKLFGAFDGPGLSKVVGMMGTLGYFVSVGEFFGGLGILLGFLTRFSAAANIVIMLGAIAMVHGANGFFLSQVDPHKNGFEYNWALIGLLVPLVIAGPGEFALGRLLPLPKRKDRPDRPLPVLE